MNSSMPPRFDNSRLTRQLARLKGNPDLLRATWTVIEAVDPKPATKLVAAVVKRLRLRSNAALTDLTILAEVVTEEHAKLLAEKEAKTAGKHAASVAECLS